MPIELTPKQSEAFHLARSGKANFILFGGAVRGGKSIWLLSTFATLASDYPGSRWAIVRESLPTLERTTLITWAKLLDMGLRSAVTDTHDNLIFTFKNKSVIFFMAENYDQDKELTRFSGLEVNGFGADEINELKEATFDKMFERAGSWIIPGIAKEKQPKPIILGTCNPSDGWVKKRIYKKYVSNSLPEGWYYIPSKITDNPHVPQTYLDSLKNLPPIKYRRFVEGDWDAKETTNAFAHNFDKQRHVSNCRLDINRVLYLSIDFNLNPFGAIAYHCWRDAEGFHFHIVDEIEIQKGSITKMIEEIKKRYSIWIPSIQITGDHNGFKSEISQADNAHNYELIRRGLRIRESQIYAPANPTHENSRAKTNFALYFHPDFRISETCEQTIFDLENVECDAFGAIIKRDRKDLKQRADFLDCVRYAINTHLDSWYRYAIKNNPHMI